MNPKSCRFLLIDRKGRPEAGAEIHAAINEGRILRLDEIRPALYEIEYAYSAPPMTPTELTLTANVGRQNVETTFSLEQLSATSPSMTLTLNTTKIILGQDKEAIFEIRGTGQDGHPLSDRALRLRTNVGSVESLSTVAPGVIRGSYTPPERNRPQVAIIAAFSGGGDGQLVAWKALPLVGKAEIPVTTEPGSMVRAQIGSTQYGPFQANESGKLTIPVEVPPGIDKMTLVVTDRIGNNSRSSLDLSAPRFPRAILNVDRPTARVDDTSPLIATAIVIRADGSPDELLEGSLSASNGTFGELVETRAGTYTASYFPPGKPGRVELRLDLPRQAGGEDLFTATAEVLAAIPSHLALNIEPKSLRTDDPPAKVQVHVLDRKGQPTSGAALHPRAEYGELGDFRELGPGEYVAAYQPPSALDPNLRNNEGEMEVPIHVEGELLPSNGIPYEIQMVTPNTLLKAGGDSCQISVKVRDRWGAPIRDVRLNLQVLSGDGHLGGDETTGSSGRAELVYTPGRIVGPIEAEVSATDHPGVRAHLLLIQAAELPEDVLPLTEAVPPGAPRPSSKLAASDSLLLKAGRVKAIQISALPNVLYMERQERSRIRVRLEDRSGNFILDPTLRIEATRGEVGEAQVHEDGLYVADYIPPPATAPIGSAKISVTNAEGEYVGSTEIRLERKDARYIGAAQVGLITNLGAVLSPTLTLLGLGRLPWGGSHFYAGGSIGFYYFGSEGPAGEGSLRNDLYPAHFILSYRQQVGRLTPFAEITPILMLINFQQDSISTIPRSGSGLFAGLGGGLGLEVGFGPGGFVGVFRASVVRGHGLADDTIQVDSSLGGISFQAGYAVHF